MLSSQSLLFGILVNLFSLLIDPSSAGFSLTIFVSLFSRIMVSGTLELKSLSLSDSL